MVCLYVNKWTTCRLKNVIYVQYSETIRSVHLQVAQQQFVVIYPLFPLVGLIILSDNGYIITVMINVKYNM